MSDANRRTLAVPMTMGALGQLLNAFASIFGCVQDPSAIKDGGLSALSPSFHVFKRES